MKRSKRQVLYRTHSIALDATPSEEVLFVQNAGAARVAYNWTLADWAENKSERDWTAIGLRARFYVHKRELDWFGDMIQSVADFAIDDLATSIQEWGKHRKALKRGEPHRFVGHPGTRKKKDGLSFRLDPRNVVFQPSGVDASGKPHKARVRVPKLGWVKMFEDLRFAGKIAVVELNKKADRWFVNATVEMPVPRPTRRRKVVGVDVGVSDLAIAKALDRRFENPRPLKAALGELRRIQKAIARSEKVNGKNHAGANLAKLRRQLRQLHVRVARLRNHWHHKVAARIADAAGRVKAETLNVAGMIRNRRLARSLADAGLARFLTTLEWHCAKRGVRFEKIDRWYPSTKKCSGCGNVKASMSMSARTYECFVCGLVMDRDDNASVNIENAPTCSDPASGDASREAVASVSDFLWKVAPAKPRRGRRGRKTAPHSRAAAAPVKDKWNTRQVHLLPSE